MKRLLCAPLACMLAAVAGCNGGVDREREALDFREDIARLTSRLRRIETENRRLVARLADLEKLARKPRAPRRPPPPRTVTPDHSPANVQPARSTGEADAGDEVTRKLQQALKGAGYDPGPVDGKKGPRTTKALKAFQRDNDLPETGTTNEVTWAILQRYLPGR